jgi:hypothetical protein
VITTALVPGSKAPLLITEDAVKRMKPGSVIVDLAAEQGGNCALTEAGKTVAKHERTNEAKTSANDVTNPAARTRPDSPLYGMPILDVDKARTVVFVKGSMGPRFSGVDNELFYLPKTMMVLGDAKKVLTELLSSVRNMGN